METSTFTFYEQTILDNIDFESYGFDNDVSRYDKIKTLYNIFKREYVHGNNQHQGEIFLFSEWLRGLPSTLTVPFYNGEILENALQFAKDNGDKALRAKLKDEDKFLNDYWGNLSKAFPTLKENL